MIFSSTVPILRSTDVRRSLTYYTDVLGFENKWEWEDPPTFGGVSKNSVEVFFCKDGQGHAGTWICVVLNNVDEFYETIKAKGAKILAAPQTYEWGMREMIVEDPDGHIIRFGQGAPPETEKEKSEAMMPATVRIRTLASTEQEVQQIPFDVNWSSSLDEVLREIPVAKTIAFIAEDTVENKVVGHLYLSFDNTGLYYVKNLAVHPGWRGRRIGTALMQELNNWLENNVSGYAYIGLHTPENLVHFYKHFGFAPAFGMFREIRRKKI